MLSAFGVKGISNVIYTEYLRINCFCLVALLHIDLYNVYTWLLIGVVDSEIVNGRLNSVRPLFGINRAGRGSVKT